MYKVHRENMPESGIRSVYDGSRVLEFIGGGEKRVKAAFADEVNINRIVDRYRKTGLVTHLSKATPQFVDMLAVEDFTETMQKMTATKSWFNGLPANVRAAFGNDVIALLEARNSEEGMQKLRGLGLAESVGGPEGKAAEGPKDPPPHPSGEAKPPAQ